VPAGATVFVQVFAHLRDEAQDVAQLALEFDEEAQRRAVKTLHRSIPRESCLTIHLALPGLTIDDPVQSITWNGYAESVQFGVSIPADHQSKSIIGTVTISLDSVPVGHIKFKLSVVVEEDPFATQESQPVGDVAHHYRLAFVSYASSDRPKVLSRVQMLTAVGIKYFQDVMNLDPGDRWEHKLYSHIDECDLFLLFWSREAKQSEWVMKEVQYALQRKGGDELNPPEIRPVIIEGPPIVEPPTELSHLHFNDRLLYLVAAEGDSSS
jgi:hypothetical protein